MARFGQKEKGKSRPYARKVRDDEPLKPSEFTAMRGLIWRLASKIKLDRLYEKLWNPVNYAIVGGIGMGINYLIWALTIGGMPWYLSNFVAILCAWSWNWANSVGPLGYLWGFEKREQLK